MRMKLSMMMAGIGLLMGAAPVVAHHAFASEFDANQKLKLAGTVTRMEWINPHTWIHLDVKGPGGKVEKWMIETGNPGGLIRRGFTRNSLPPGSEIVVVGYRAKDGSTTANGVEVTFADGRKVFIGSSGTGAPAP